MNIISYRIIQQEEGAAQEVLLRPSGTSSKGGQRAATHTYSYRNKVLPRSMTWENNESYTPQDKRFIGIYPNPADAEVFIEYPVDAQEMESRLEIRNLDGRLIDTIKLKHQNGIISLASADWAPGMYIVSFVVNGRQMDTEKFSVAH